MDFLKYMIQKFPFMIDNFLVKIIFLAVKIDFFDAKYLINSHLQDFHPVKPGFSGQPKSLATAKKSRRGVASNRDATTLNPGLLSIFWVSSRSSRG